jgi:hypothetical protein
VKHVGYGDEEEQEATAKDEAEMAEEHGRKAKEVELQRVGRWRRRCRHSAGFEQLRGHRLQFLASR